MSIIAVMMVPPTFESTARAKIEIKGYWDVLPAASVAISPPQNKIARSMANARTPLMTTLNTIDRATLVEASLTSSDILKISTVTVAGWVVLHGRRRQFLANASA